MKRISLILAASSLMLASCASFLTPERCASINIAASTAEQIAAVLQAEGVQPAAAAKLAVAVKTFQMSMAVACEQANPPAVTSLAPVA